MKPLIIIAMWMPLLPSHDTWMNGKEVDPTTKSLCCGNGDCKVYPLEHAHMTAEGWYLEITNETIPWARVQFSPDGFMWRCSSRMTVPDKTICFFAPVFGM